MGRQDELAHCKCDQSVADQIGKMGKGVLTRPVFSLKSNIKREMKEACHKFGLPLFAQLESFGGAWSGFGSQSVRQ